MMIYSTHNQEDSKYYIELLMKLAFFELIIPLCRKIDNYRGDLRCNNQSVFFVY